jgi:hypothetical protein
MPVKKTTLQGAEYLDYWDDMFGEDCVHYLQGAGPFRPCAFCGLHYKHSDPCQELQDSWNTMDFGKHQGRHINDVPTGYLEFCITKGLKSKEDRYRWLEELRKRDDKYNTAIWQRRAELGAYL